MANGLSSPNSILGEAATDLPVLKLAQPLQLNLGQTGGARFSSVGFSAISE